MSSAAPDQSTAVTSRPCSAPSPAPCPVPCPAKNSAFLPLPHARSSTGPTGNSDHNSVKIPAGASAATSFAARLCFASHSDGLDGIKRSTRHKEKAPEHCLLGALKPQNPKHC